MQNFHYISDLLKTDVDFILELLNEFWDTFWLSGYVRNEPIIQKRLSEFSENKNKFSFCISEYNDLNNQYNLLKNKIIQLEQEMSYLEKFNNNLLNKGLEEIGQWKRDNEITYKYKREENFNKIMENSKTISEILKENDNNIKLIKIKKEELINLYKNFKTKYPFFIDYQIEQML